MCEHFQLNVFVSGDLVMCSAVEFNQRLGLSPNKGISGAWLKRAKSTLNATEYTHDHNDSATSDKMLSFAAGGYRADELQDSRVYSTHVHDPRPIQSHPYSSLSSSSVHSSLFPRSGSSLNLINVIVLESWLDGKWQEVNNLRKRCGSMPEFGQIARTLKVSEATLRSVQEWHERTKEEEHDSDDDTEQTTPQTNNTNEIIHAPLVRRKTDISEINYLIYFCH